MEFARIAFGALVGGLVSLVVSFTILSRYAYRKRTEKRSIWPALLASLACLSGVALVVLQPRLRAYTSVSALVVAFISTALGVFVVAYRSKKAPQTPEKLMPLLDSYGYQAREKINQGEFQSGLELAERALAASPRDVNAYIEKARALKRLGDLGKALETVEKGLEVEHDNPRLLYNRACYLSLLRQDESRDQEILNDLQRAFQLMPKLKNFAMEDSDFNHVRHLKGFRTLFVGGLVS